MRLVKNENRESTSPLFFEKAHHLAELLKALSVQEISKIMKVSSTLAQKTHELIASWTISLERQSLAIDSFIGDIYSGLRAEELSEDDRDHAEGKLFILSGLYGILRPSDAIFPYRLELGYKFQGPGFENLYDYWGDSIAKCLPKNGPIINLASEEFSRTITPFVDQKRVITPQFLTVSPKNGKPTFVAVHSKITRGAFAHWLIVNRVEDVANLLEFNDLGYKFDEKLSIANHPTFVCKEFGGKGLSIKMKAKSKDI